MPIIKKIPVFQLIYNWLIYFDGHLQVRLTNYCSIEKIYMLLVIWSSVPHKIPHHRDFFEKYLLLVIWSSVPHKIPYPRNFDEKLLFNRKNIYYWSSGVLCRTKFHIIVISMRNFYFIGKIFITGHREFWAAQNSTSS